MKLKIEHITTIILLFSLSISGYSQNNSDFINLTGKKGFPQSFEFTYNEKVSEYNTLLNLSLPISVSRTTVWQNTLYHFFYNVEGFPVSPPGAEINTVALNGFIIQTGIYKRLDYEKSIQVLLTPRMMSDFYNADGKSIQLGGIFIYENTFNDDFSLGYGAMYNSEFFGPYLLPLLNINWQDNSDWRIEGLFPLNLKILFVPNDIFSIGISHDNLITSYYLRDPKFEGDYVVRQNFDLALYTNIRLFGNFYWETKIGRTLNRSYKQYESDQKVSLGLPYVFLGDNRTVKNMVSQNGFFITSGIVYNINLLE